MKKLRIIIIVILAVAGLKAKGQNGLVAYWSFDEFQAGTFKDLSGEKNHGTAFGAESIDGVKGEALYFDGNGDYATIGNGQHTNPSDFNDLGAGSISLWFRVDHIPLENGIAPIFYYGGLKKCDFFDAANEGLIIEVGHSPVHYGSKSLYFTIWANGCTFPSFCFDSNDAIETGKWYHIVIVVGEDYNTGYLNGQEMTNRSYNFGTPGHSQFFEDARKHEVLWLGKGHWDRTEQFFEGAIDEIRIYNRPLAADEVEELYGDVLGATNLTRQIEDEKKVIFYPNPVMQNLNYDIRIEGIVHADLEIIDNTGKLMIKKSGLPSSGSINIQSLNPGLYTLIFTADGGKSLRRRFMVNK